MRFGTNLHGCSKPVTRQHHYRGLEVTWQLSTNHSEYPRTVNSTLLTPQNLLRLLERRRSIVMSMSVCVSVCLSGRISPEPHARSLPIFVHVAYSMCVARSSSGTLTIGRIAYQREWGDGNAQRGRSVIYDCHDYWVCKCLELIAIKRGLPACQVSSWSGQPFGHNTNVRQDRQTDRTDNGLIA